MTNKVLLILIGLSILSIIAGILIQSFATNVDATYFGLDLYSFSFWIGTLLGLALLLANGTFIYSLYFRISCIAILVVLAGAALKILHWTSYADSIIVMGLVLIMLIYAWHFLQKPTKKFLDYFKLFWVITAYSLNIGNYLHLIPNDYPLFGNYLLWLLVLYFAFTGLRNRTIFREEV